jgi:hypothetical protein
MMTITKEILTTIFIFTNNLQHKIFLPVASFIIKQEIKENDIKFHSEKIFIFFNFSLSIIQIKSNNHIFPSM